ncbi:ribonuclease P protein component [Glutamicibacter protophormiae]|uniref:ribonuclease P protein component n=1 Tax=Glutamicibacter protophormiae TaxID=37930 RepID=UPI00166D6E2B|nr:ribonuclease P protein component [Glutamicibacter protophormiae]QRQ78701.1 ribonuclease P protein component [Glutamicibacter protophormiae]WPR64762.1 ribonuclease P protein component [Glutamicibacter protophormiae]WPR68258.1 ribonuclease P protein component [Glutamicibacter protophormiae]GGL96917.1 ribonuclease P protein component [Glutamicibacter protophormiae]
MLPKNQRLRLAQDLTATVRSGVRSGRRNVVLYARPRTDEESGDRFGFIVSKAVGIAVKRNLAKRRMREIAHELRRADGNLDIVVRALPGAAEISWDEIHSQVSSAFASAVRKAEAR